MSSRLRIIQVRTNDDPQADPQPGQLCTATYTVTSVTTGEVVLVQRIEPRVSESTHNIEVPVDLPLGRYKFAVAITGCECPAPVPSEITVNIKKPYIIVGIQRSEPSACELHLSVDQIDQLSGLDESLSSSSSASSTLQQRLRRQRLRNERNLRNLKPARHGCGPCALLSSNVYFVRAFDALNGVTFVKAKKQLKNDPCKLSHFKSGPAARGCRNRKCGAGRRVRGPRGGFSPLSCPRRRLAQLRGFCIGCL